MPLFGPPNIEKLRTKGNVKGLTKALCSKSMDLRQTAAKALDTLNWQPGRDQIGALYWIGKREWDKCIDIGESAVEPLVAVLLNVNSVEKLRQDAAQALGQIGDSRAVEPLIVALADKNAEGRRRAAEALGRIGDDRAVEPLIVALADMNGDVHISAAVALGRIGDDRAVDSLIRNIEGVDGVPWKLGIREALVKIGAPAVEPLIVALADKDMNRKVRRRAAEALGRIGDDRAVEPLIVALADMNDEDRQWAANALGRIGDDRAVEPLIVALADKNEDSIAPMMVAWALGQIGDDRAVDSLIRNIEGRHRVWNEGIREALVKIGAPAVEPLIVALADKNAEGRRRAAEALGRIGDDRAVEPLIVALADMNNKDRQWAAEALGNIGKPAVGQLLVALKDDNPDVRALAASTLEQIGDAKIVKSLVPLLRDSNSHVRNAALKALQEFRWEPDEDVEQAAFWLVSGEVSRLGELDGKAVKQLLIESMEWQMDQSDWFIKGQIAKLLVRPGILARDSALARVVDELDAYARKCEEELNEMFQNPRKISLYADVPKTDGRIFGDYENLLAEATTYFVSTSGDGSGGTWYIYDNSPSRSAVKALCHIVTPVSTNLLHHIRRLRDLEVREQDAEVEYDAEHPSGMAYRNEVLSFKSQRKLAAAELARRGNPKYDLSVFKAEGCWRIPA